MLKLLAVTCTVGFALFWVFAGLAVLAFIDSHPLLWVLVVTSLAGLAVGIWARLRLNRLTSHIPVGQRVYQRD